MVATSQRGATGVLRETELWLLLRCANCSATLSTDTFQEAVSTFDESEQQLELPPWLGMALTGGGTRKLVVARRAVGLLLQLSTRSTVIKQLYQHFVVAGRMVKRDWLNFVSAEQMDQMTPYSDERNGLSTTATPCSHDGDGAQENPQVQTTEFYERSTENAGGEQRQEQGMTLLQFSLELLSPNNDVCAPARRSSECYQVDLQAPLSHYVVACSHNSHHNRHRRGPAYRTQYG
eukprot:4120631-Prymnesium_polylepis.1